LESKLGVMNETKLLETLRSMAHYIVRNEIMTEHFLLEGKLLAIDVTPTP